MPGTMIGKLNEHFKDFMLNHWWHSVTIKHLVSESINPMTGLKTKVETTFYVQAIVERLKKKDMEMFPNIFTVQDRRMYCSSDDISVEKGDLVEDENEEKYIVQELEKIDKLYRAYLKRI